MPRETGLYILQATPRSWERLNYGFIYVLSMVVKTVDFITVDEHPAGLPRLIRHNSTNFVLV